MSDVLKELFANDLWANARIVACLKADPERNQQALRLLAHLLAAEKIWLLRLQGKDTSETDKFPALSLDDCEALANENQQGYSRFLDSLTGEGLDSLVTYRNFNGSEFRTRVRDILMHVALHGTYHRGQIALTAHGEGFDPIDTDFMTFVQQAVDC
jgi:uncharacterized damage-inducible protein DinB